MYNNSNTGNDIKVKNGNSLNYVRFDVGHYLYVCHKGTIMKFENCVLAKYISPQFDRRQSELDYIVIDRDGKHFGSILNYMRDQTCLDLSQWTKTDLTDLMREADFYCLNELVQLCEFQFGLRDRQLQHSCDLEHQQTFNIPAGHKLEVIYGIGVMIELLEATKRPTIVISYLSMRRLHIDSWIEELVKLCDYNKFRVYCFADKDLNSQSPQFEIPNLHKYIALTDFIMCLYEPEEHRFLSHIPAPPYDRFRAKRAHYKCKIFKFWFLIQNELASNILTNENTNSG